MDIWKDIPGYEWIYQVSNLWNVRGLDRKWTKWSLLRGQVRKDWYKHINLSLKGKRKKLLVHRLVYLTFNNLPLKFEWPITKTLVLHRDDNPWNNHIDNLFLWTQKENMQDCSKKQRIYVRKGEESNFSKLTNKKVKLIRLMISMWEPLKFIASHWEVNIETIRHIKNWRSWKHIK